MFNNECTLVGALDFLYQSSFQRAIESCFLREVVMNSINIFAVSSPLSDTNLLNWLKISIANILVKSMLAAHACPGAVYLAQH